MNRNFCFWSVLISFSLWQPIVLAEPEEVLQTPNLESPQAEQPQQSSSQEQLESVTGLPAQFQFQGRTFRQQTEAIQDIGRFVTNGTRVDSYVIFWEISPREVSLRQPPQMPDPLPKNLYLITPERQFVRFSF